MNIARLAGTSWLAYEDGRGILIDAGRDPDGGAIIKRIRRLGIDVPMLFLTHTHYDHTRGAEAVRQATGAKVIVGKEESGALRTGQTPVPAATGRLGHAVLRFAKVLNASTGDRYQPVTKDIIEITESGPLEGYGPDVRIYRLGAHTAGSIGLRIGEDFFAGDTVFGFGSAIYPPFADYPDQFPHAWSVILNSGAKRIYPGHGKPFSVDVLRKQYQSRYSVQ